MKTSYTILNYTGKFPNTNPLLFSLSLFFCYADLLALEQSKTFYKPDWFDIVESEVKCCKEAVCVIDMSSFTKFEITVSIWEPIKQTRELCLFFMSLPN